MASGFYRCGQDLHPDHLDFIRPDLPLVQPSEAPRSNPQQNKAARGTERALQALHTGLAGLGDIS